MASIKANKGTYERPDSITETGELGQAEGIGFGQRVLTDYHRVYNMALEESIAWYVRKLRPAFSKATVSAWRVPLEERGLGSSSIIIRMSAIRKLAVEAVDNGLLAPEMAA